MKLISAAFCMAAAAFLVLHVGSPEVGSGPASHT